MTKKKSTKRAFISSMLILAMCFTMLAGTTFAWFTDSVSSGSNIIKSGKLDVDLLVKGGNIDTATYGTDYVSLDANPGLAIFNYDLWEPGYTVVANAKVVNKGNLALKYTLKIAATGTASELAEVIDVYYAPSVVTVADRDLAHNANLRKLGTLADVLAGGANVTINDTLIPGTNEEDFATIALQMQTTAGNEYQEKSIGSGFTLQLLATQYTYEEDSFDEQYDADAEFPVAEVDTLDELKAAIANPDIVSVTLTDDIDLGNTQLHITHPVTIDGAGKEITYSSASQYSVSIYASADVALKNVTVKNESATNNWVVWAADGVDVALENSTIETGFYGIGTAGNNNISIVGSKVKGWSAVSLQNNNVKVTVKDSELTGTNNFSGSNNAYAIFPLAGGSNNTIDVENSTLNVNVNANAYEMGVYTYNGASNNAISFKGCTFNLEQSAWSEGAAHLALSWDIWNNGNGGCANNTLTVTDCVVNSVSYGYNNLAKTGITQNNSGEEYFPMP